MIAAVPSSKMPEYKGVRSGVYFSSLSFFNTSCFSSCPMAPNSTELMWGPGLIGFIIATVYGLALLSLYPILTCRVVKALWDIFWAVYVLLAIFSARFEKTQIIHNDSLVGASHNIECMLIPWRCHSLFETIHQCAMIGIYWSILISCRRSSSLECTMKLPWQMLASTSVFL
ncbi:hypothetical protein EDD22DRAFT_923301 [Suillus occidentalis]|nr:hypothetical protein EDD22DRAFT_923301 [Suillus occidentalis]